MTSAVSRNTSGKAALHPGLGGISIPLAESWAHIFLEVQHTSERNPFLWSVAMQYSLFSLCTCIKKTYLKLTRNVSTNSYNSRSSRSQPSRYSSHLVTETATSVLLPGCFLHGFDTYNAEGESSLMGNVCVWHHFLHSPCEERKFSPHNLTWKLIGQVTARQYQLAFKVKVITDVATVATTADAAADFADRTSLVRTFCRMLPPKSAVCPRTISRDLKHGDGITGGSSFTREACTIQSLQCPEKGGKTIEAKEAKTAYNNAKLVAKHAAWRSLRQSKRNSLQHPRMVTVFSISPNRWTTETRSWAGWNATRALAHLAS